MDIVLTLPELNNVYEQVINNNNQKLGCILSIKY